jgi:hypothetical protein
MGMGSAQGQQPQAGMSGKGGAQNTQRPQQPQQPQVQQPPQGSMAGKGGVARPNPNVINPIGPKPGMAGKGGGASYPFPNQPVQPQVQPPQAGMGGKGVGQPQVDPNVLTSLQSVLQGQATQPQQAGLAGKGLGQAPQTQPGMGGKGMTSTGGPLPLNAGQQDLINNPNTPEGRAYAASQLDLQRAIQNGTYAPQDLMAQRAAFDAANAQPVANPVNDPYAARLQQAPKPMVTPVKPIAPVSNPKNMLPAPVVNKKNQQQIAAEAKQQQMQRQIQQLAAKVRGKQ